MTREDEHGATPQDPPQDAQAAKNGELDDEQLGNVAGGWGISFLTPTSQTTSTGTSTDKPTESISFNYGKVEY